MAEREERILIIKLNQKPCDSCNVIRGCAGSCILESKWYNSMTRQEVISCMAKAISDAAKRSCNKEFVAEAALNALLEE